MKKRVRAKVDEISDKVGDLGSRVETSFHKNRKKIKKPFIRLVFSRAAFVALITLIQFAIFFFAFSWLEEKSSYFIEACAIVSVVVIIWIINSWSNPAYKISWAILVAALPVMGTLLYLYTHINIDGKIPFMKLNRNIRDTAHYALTDRNVRHSRMQHDPDFNKLADYVELTGGYPTYQNTEVRHYALGDYSFRDMCNELEKARSFIFMEYFIVESGIFWDTVLEILERKAKEGVEVRFMYDDVGCATTLPRKYCEVLQSKGINAKAFTRLKPFFSTAYNNRDHRKITVIDGKVAFSGGINLADEYINEVERFGEWKDNAFMLKGDAVRNYTLMFLQMWNVYGTSAEGENYGRYLDIESGRTPDPENDGFVIPYGDGPHKQDNVAENVYIDVINNAIEYVHIMTPYLIPDNEMLHALKHAAKSGVEVSIILPYIPDKKIVNMLTKSYYSELIRSGVHIFEYEPGFVHSKLMVADDKIAVEGTVNFDFRSLYLHYECGCIMYENRAVFEIVEDVRDTRTRCREITMEDYRNYGTFFRWASSILRVFAPLL